NSFNFGVGGNLTSHFDRNNIDTTNLADGRPIYYVKYGKNTIYGSSTKAATFYCILCNNVTVKDLEMSNMDRGVYFWETSNSRLQNITVKQSGWGLFMRNSSDNSIKDSKFSTNNQQDYSETGVTVYYSNNNTFENN
ncbi:MAG: right-handed parallel beta-helix repeat-containing protein, partial [Candidatus Methanoperedens sp.]|nr:right-handed parallel beta-helix repeat-containing protein [Candidatus Methanoperedens sp.]